MRLLAAAIVLCAASCAAPGPEARQRPEPADLLLLHGTVRTMDPRQPEAEALAARHGVIVYVGDSRGAEAFRGPRTRVVELEGRTACPGFTDSHLHLSGFARTLSEVDLTGTMSEADVVARTVAAATSRAPGTWILGRGWDQNDWADTSFPVHGPLSAALPAHPVALRRVDGHALLVNAAALMAAGIDGSTPDPPGGRLLRDEHGTPTGVLVDNAMELVEKLVPPMEPAALAEAVRRAIVELHRHGITAVHDAGVPWSDVEVYADLARRGQFSLRARVMLDGTLPDDWRTDRGVPTSDLTGQGLIAVRAMKFYADGALGSRGAALLDDYSDDPGNRGLLLTDEATLTAACERALRGGWQVCTHAIGDRGNRLVLDCYERALAAVPVAERAPGGSDPRFRIEHAQVLSAADVPRFAALGVIASMQCQHQTSDMPWAQARLGPERVKLAYAWRSLLDAGARLTGGSDCPVERPDPLAALHAAVTRSDEHGEPFGGWHHEQAMTRAEALASITAWPAYAAFDEQRLGSLAVGKLADIVVLSEDPLTAPEGALGNIRVDATIFDGGVVSEN
jgi:predicted amidohydrolase YtcJ